MIFHIPIVRILNYSNLVLIRLFLSDPLNLLFTVHNCFVLSGLLGP